MTYNVAALASQSDSLIELLAAQCVDLEALLVLARAETSAVEQRDFDEVMRVVGERATLGERLEIYQRQIALLREEMKERAEPALHGETAAHAVGLVASIQLQDERTRPLLLAARQDLQQQQAQLTQAERSARRYANAQRSVPIACDQRA